MSSHIVYDVSMPECLLFLRCFCRNPLQVSSVIPTSPRIARRLASRIQHGSSVVVEYGPGTGVLARAILASNRLSSDSIIILIEKSAKLVEHLRRTFTDPRVHVIHESAEHVEAILHQYGKKADYIFSSIPLSVMADDTIDQILGSSRSVLSDTGKLIIFLFHPRVRKILLRYFSTVRTNYEIVNFPPLCIFETSKKAAFCKAA